MPGRPRWGHTTSTLLQIKFSLTGFQLLLFLNVLTNPLFIQAYRTHAIPRGPEMADPSSAAPGAAPGESVQHFCPSGTPACEPHCTWAEYSNTDAHAPAYNALPTVPPLLTAQLPQNRANLSLEPSIQHSLTVLWYNYHVVLALPPNVGQTLPLMHASVLLPAPRGLPGRRAYHDGALGVHAGSLRSSSGRTARGRGFTLY